MATTLTLKNIPDEVYVRLKASAAMNRRSLNSEAIMCLETVLSATNMTTRERLDRARALRATPSGAKSHARDIDDFKRIGRP